MQPEAVDMARVAVLVLLACLACTTPTVVAQDLYSGSGSGSGDYYGDHTMVDQEKDSEDVVEVEEFPSILKYKEDKEFHICNRYPYGETHVHAYDFSCTCLASKTRCL